MFCHPLCFAVTGLISDDPYRSCHFSTVVYMKDIASSAHRRNIYATILLYDTNNLDIYYDHNHHITRRLWRQSFTVIVDHTLY